MLTLNKAISTSWLLDQEKARGGVVLGGMDACGLGDVCEQDFLFFLSFDSFVFPF